MKKFLIGLVCALIVCGCYDRPRYYHDHDEGYHEGYTVENIAPDTVRVGYHGDGGPDRLQDMVLLRASELTIQAGYSFFIVQPDGSRDAWRYKAIVAQFVRERQAGVTYDAVYLRDSIRQKYNIAP